MGFSAIDSLPSINKLKYVTYMSIPGRITANLPCLGLTEDILTPMKSNTMNAHENTHTEPPRECPNLLKALVYFNFVLLFFVGIMFFGDLKNVVIV